jgi:predicted RNA binding protein YcfA (HicA-like mRNA interferase family)
MYAKLRFRSEDAKTTRYQSSAIVKVLEKTGFRIVRQGKHIVMSDGIHFVTIPCHNPVHAYTMAGIVRDAGLTIEEFKKLLHCNHEFCSPRPLWAAVQILIFAISATTHKGSRLQKLT